MHSRSRRLTHRSVLFFLIPVYETMSIISHVSIGSTPDKMKEMLALYDAIADGVGAKRKMAISKDGKEVGDLYTSEELVAVAYGKYYPVSYDSQKLAFRKVLIPNYVGASPKYSGILGQSSIRQGSTSCWQWHTHCIYMQKLKASGRSLQSCD